MITGYTFDIAFKHDPQIWITTAKSDAEIKGCAYRRMEELKRRIEKLLQAAQIDFDELIVAPVFEGKEKGEESNEREDTRIRNR